MIESRFSVRSIQVFVLSGEAVDFIQIIGALGHLDVLIFLSDKVAEKVDVEFAVTD